MIVGTLVLGLGLDLPDMRLILHINYTRMIRDYAQESGRAGRDNLPSQVVLVRTES